MKANSNKALLQIITGQGINLDASSLNKVRRAVAAGIKPDRIIMTSQEVPEDDDRCELEELILRISNIIFVRYVNCISLEVLQKRIILNFQ